MKNKPGGMKVFKRRLLLPYLNEYIKDKETAKMLVSAFNKIYCNIPLPKTMQYLTSQQNIN
tara:strand:- start:375 stop:557 length:183 start_codon:yes stop_codon:yes gene_type:complete